MPATHTPQTARFYTAARRVPVLIGKINGTRIWGGPYTLTQLGVGGVVLWAGYQTIPFWGAGFVPLVRLIVLVGVAFGVTWSAGRIPSTRRKIPDLAIDLVASVSLPELGRYKGSPVRIARPHYVSGSVLLHLTNPEQPVFHRAPVALRPTAFPIDHPIAAPARETKPTPAIPDAEDLPANVTPIRPRHATGVERLLEQARQKETHP